MLHEIYCIFNASFEVTKLKTEKEFTDFFENSNTGKTSEELNKELYNLFLNSKKQRLHEALLNLSKLGLKSYFNWKLSFPYISRISEFNNDFINDKLANLEKEITCSVINILLFLKTNFTKIGNTVYFLPVILHYEKILNKKYPIHSTEFKISRYKDYLNKIEKEIFIKYLYYSGINKVEFQYIGSHDLDSVHSGFGEQLNQVNKSFLSRLEYLKNENTLNYYSYINEIQKTQPVTGGTNSKAFEIEQNFTKEVLQELKLSFKEEFREKIFTSLKPYFADNAHSVLKNLLNSENNYTGNKIVFHQVGTCLTYFFKTLYNEAIIISNSKTTIQNWMIENFQYMYNGSAKDFTADTIQKTLFREGKPPKHVIELNF